ncbi:MAG TPA: helix-turn-helix domain-containing protein [Thermoanaerobaculia bacterium]|nr:helix-turn-helix domain-containing protein [Thermoanaerobaculia bacterium]
MSRTDSARSISPGTAEDSLRADDVREIRYKLRQSQADFAAMIGVTLAMLQRWEEGRARPDGPALALLRVAAKNPKIVARALGH